MPAEEWWSWRGLDVHLDRMASPEAKLKVIVLHGAGAYGRVMAPVSVLAKKHGYETVAPDLPGYGLTRAPWGSLRYQLWIDCVCDLVAAEKKRDGRPIAIFGVSLGGLLAYQAAAQTARAGGSVAGIMATTFADTREPAVRAGFAKNRLLGGAGVWAMRNLSPLLDPLPLPMGQITKMDRISNNPALSALCSGDRLGGGTWMPARFLRTFLEAEPAIEPEAFRVCPILLAHPGEDRMTDIVHSQRFFDRLGGEKKMIVLEGASHFPLETPGIDQLQRAALDFFAALAA